MSTRCKRMALVLVAGFLLAGLLATGTFSQSPGPSTACGGPGEFVAPNRSLSLPLSLSLSPTRRWRWRGILSTYSNPSNGVGPNASYPLPPTAFTPTQNNPFPNGYIPGPFAATRAFRARTPTRQVPGVIHVFLLMKDAHRVFERPEDAWQRQGSQISTTATLPPNQEFQYWVTANLRAKWRDSDPISQGRSGSR